MNEKEGYIFICTGPCDPGRKSCPCPESCEMSPRDEHEGWGAWVIPVGLIGAICAVALLWHVSGYFVSMK